MIHPGRILSMVLAGLLLGLGSAWYAITGGAGTAVPYGQWDLNPLIGSSAAGLWDRARVARHALLALTRDEAVYFVGGRDSAGRGLSADGVYRIRGGALPSRWWSITAYGGDHFLIPNEGGRYSFSSETVTRRADGSFEIMVSREPQPGDWLPLGEAREFDLFLRIYNPEREPAAADLPVIERVDGDE